MAIKDGNVRLTVTMPKEIADAVREEAKEYGLSTSNYVYLVLVANNHRVDSRLGDLAENQLEVLREISWGFEPDELRKNAPKLV
jgi:hypothetical protein